MRTGFREVQLDGLTKLSESRGYRVYEVAADVRPEWETKSLSQEVPFGVSDLILWKYAISGVDSTLCIIHNDESKLLGGFAVHHWPVRTLPGHRILRLENFGETIPVGAEYSVIKGIIALASRFRRALRIDIELFERDAERRARISSVIQRKNFDRLTKIRTYEKTLAIDLQRDDETLLSSFSARARRQIRKAQRYPIHVSPITDESFIPQLEALQRETFDRTGGIPPKLPWRGLLSSARDFPDRIKVFGAIYGGNESSKRLVAYAVLLRNGTSAQYHAAGSTRLPDRRVPLMYPVIWDALRWGRDGGSTWFDFGGITDGSSKSYNDAVGGISEFKRNFGGITQPICENWRFVLAPARQYFANLVGQLIS